MGSASWDGAIFPGIPVNIQRNSQRQLFMLGLGLTDSYPDGLDRGSRID